MRLISIYKRQVAMTFKKITYGLVAALLLSGSVASAQSVERAAPAAAGAGPLAGAWPFALFAAFAVSLVLVVESGENNDDLPVSP